MYLNLELSLCSSRSLYSYIVDLISVSSHVPVRSYLRECRYSVMVSRDGFYTIFDLREGSII